MPAIAAAALSKIGREMPLRPRMSTTECMTQTSLSPTKSPKRRRPEAHGETNSLGTPTGSACMAAAPSSAPSAPPRHSTPCTRPSANWRTTTSRTPSRISATAAPREPAPRTSANACPPARATSSRVTSGAIVGPPRMPESITTDVHPQRRQPLAHVGDLLALGVERADERDRGHQTATASAARRWSIESWA